MSWIGLAVEPGCPKRLRRSTRCPVCTPLFLKMRKFPGGDTGPSGEPLSSQMVDGQTDGGCDTSAFSGVSARKEGLAAEIEAEVEGVVLFLQSGLGHERAARRYMSLRDPDRLFCRHSKHLAFCRHSRHEANEYVHS